MIKSRNSLKAKVSNLANKTNIPNKYLIQNFMFEALLKRISKSKYKDKFIIKGGFLLSSIFGVNLRSTMDLDTTIKGLPLDRETITKVINEIISIEIDDNIKLEIENIKNIREEELYSGFKVNLKAEFDGLKTNLMIDITTGDAITYKEVEFKYMLADGKYTRMKGVVYEIAANHLHDGHCDGHTVTEIVGTNPVTGLPIYGTDTEYRDDDCCY